MNSPTAAADLQIIPMIYGTFQVRTADGSRFLAEFVSRREAELCAVDPRRFGLWV